MTPPDQNRWGKPPGVSPFGQPCAMECCAATVDLPGRDPSGPGAGDPLSADTEPPGGEEVGSPARLLAEKADRYERALESLGREHRTLTTEVERLRSALEAVIERSMNPYAALKESALPDTRYIARAALTPGGEPSPSQRKEQ